MHKAQGSEYPVVVMPIIEAHYRNLLYSTLLYSTLLYSTYFTLLYLQAHGLMLYRNLLYTGLSRAKRLLVFVGSTNAIRNAVRSDSMPTRNTLLAERITVDDFAPPTTRHM